MHLFSSLHFNLAAMLSIHISLSMCKIYFSEFKIIPNDKNSTQLNVFIAMNLYHKQYVQSGYRFYINTHEYRSSFNSFEILQYVNGILYFVYNITRLL